MGEAAHAGRALSRRHAGRAGTRGAGRGPRTS